MFIEEPQNEVISHTLNITEDFQKISENQTIMNNILDRASELASASFAFLDQVSMK